MAAYFKQKCPSSLRLRPEYSSSVIIPSNVFRSAEYTGVSIDIRVPSKPL